MERMANYKKRTTALSHFERREPWRFCSRKFRFLNLHTFSLSLSCMYIYIIIYIYMETVALFWKKVNIFFLIESKLPILRRRSIYIHSPRKRTYIYLSIVEKTFPSLSFFLSLFSRLKYNYRVSFDWLVSVTFSSFIYLVEIFVSCCLHLPMLYCFSSFSHAFSFFFFFLMICCFIVFDSLRFKKNKIINNRFGSCAKQ